MADTSLPHVTRATFFRNGDPNFKGKMMVVNPRYYRNFESFLDTVTWSTQSTNAVTRICTPHGRNYIHNVDSFENGGNYIAVGRERFRRLNYGEEKNKNSTVRLPPVWRSQRASSGRYRKVYEGERQALKRIHVYRNGDSKTPARMILLKKRTLTDMELVLSALQESRINFDFAISKLFTLDGKQIYSCDEIEHDGRYVALERGRRFKPINYNGGNSNFSPRNAVPNFTKLPPIAARINPAKISYSPKKNPDPPAQARLVPQPPKQDKPKRGKKRENKRSKEPVIAQDSIISLFEDQNLQRESFSNVSLSVTPPPLDESPDFALSENDAKRNENVAKIPEKSESPDVAMPSVIDNDPDEQQATMGLKLYNASGMQKEWGDMVTENKKTVTDKLIDDIPAEEIVDEEITENSEDSLEKTKISESLSDVEDQTEGAEETGKRSIDKDKETDQQDEQEEKEEENEIEDNKHEEIAATANKLIEKILQEEEDEQTALAKKPKTPPVDDTRSKSQSPVEEIADEDDEEVDEDDNTEKEDNAAQSPQPSVASSQEEEDMNSEDEMKSSDEEEENDDDDDNEKDDDDDEDEEEKSDEKESEDEKDDTDPQSEGSEAEEPATKENKTNKKVEEQRADPVAAKKSEIKQSQAKGARRGKRIDNKA